MNRITKYIIIIVIILAVIFASIYGFTYAKYAANSVWNYYLKSNGFYFSSDLLNENNPNHVNNNWDGSTIVINIKNSNNDALITNYNINYEVECNVVGDSNKKCVINNTGMSNYAGILNKEKECSSKDYITEEECKNNGYEMKDKVANQDISIQILNNDGTEVEDQSDIILDIEIRSTLPYSKTLKGRFTLHKNINLKDNITSKITDSIDNIIYNISNYTMTNKCLKLNWDSTYLKIDVNLDDVISYKVDSNDYINEIVFKLDSQNDKEYTFYKSDIQKVYDLTDFSLTELNCQ